MSPVASRGPYGRVHTTPAHQSRVVSVVSSVINTSSHRRRARRNTITSNGATVITATPTALQNVRPDSRHPNRSSSSNSSSSTTSSTTSAVLALPTADAPSLRLARASPPLPPYFSPTALSRFPPTAAASAPSPSSSWTLASSPSLLCLSLPLPLPLQSTSTPDRTPTTAATSASPPCTPSDAAMAVNGSYYGRDRFDPLLILAQIILLQTAFYLSNALLLAFFNRATAASASLVHQMFNPASITLKHFPGWLTCTALLLSAVGPTSLVFVAVVGRARRAIDFSCTLLLTHVVAVTVFARFPTSLVWWAVHVLAAALLATVAEFLSLRLELRDIAVRRDVKRGGESAAVDLESPAVPEDGDTNPDNVANQLVSNSS